MDTEAGSARPCRLTSQETGRLPISPILAPKGPRVLQLLWRLTAGLAKLAWAQSRLSKLECPIPIHNFGKAPVQGDRLRSSRQIALEPHQPKHENSHPISQPATRSTARKLTPAASRATRTTGARLSLIKVPTADEGGPKMLEAPGPNPRDPRQKKSRGHVRNQPEPAPHQTETSRNDCRIEPENAASNMDVEIIGLPQK